ncbi:MAG: hypothetical protein AAGM04_13120, partial [Pseudomonadota bacterium]
MSRFAYVLRVSTFSIVALCIMLGAAAAKTPGQDEAVANAIATARYEAAVTRNAETRHWNARFKRQRDKIEDLSLQVELAKDATGAAAAEARAVRAQLREAQDAYVEELAALDRAYKAAISAFRDSLEKITATPEGLKALELYNAGDRLRARSILDDLADAADRADERATNIRKAARQRELATLDLDMLLRGELTVKTVLARFERITRLDPTSQWDWVEYGRLLVKAGDLSAAKLAAEQALETANETRNRMVAYGALGDVQ